MDTKTQPKDLRNLGSCGSEKRKDAERSLAGWKALVLGIASSFLNEKLAAGCRHRQQVASSRRCEITGGACEKPWKCPRLREPVGCEAGEIGEREKWPIQKRPGGTKGYDGWLY